MSIMSNIHTVVNYNPKKSEPFSGQRLSTVIYRNKDNTTASAVKQSQCVSIPTLLPDAVKEAFLNTETQPALNSLLTDYLRSIQDSIIKSAVNSGATAISDSDINIESCIEYHNNTSESVRLTSESVRLWFESDVIDSLTALIAEKMSVSENPTDTELNRISAIATAYKDKIAKLASGAVIYESHVCRELSVAVGLAYEESSIKTKLLERLDKMSKVEKKVDLFALS